MGIGCYESTLHITGEYPSWWEGRVFARPVNWWVAGKTNETTRDILQRKMFGETRQYNGRKWVSGTGMVPFENIVDLSWKAGVPDLLDTVRIRHSSGGISSCGLKSYQQGRGSFEGTEQHGVHIDEECPLDVYTECLIRTATTNGIILVTFTPLEGLTDLVMEFLPGGKLPTTEGP